MKNLKILFKILVPMVTLLTVVLIANIFLLSQMHEINNKSVEISKNWLPSVEVTSIINTMTSDFRIAEFTQLTSINEEKKVEADNLREKTGNDIAIKQKEYETLISSDEERNHYKIFSQTWASYIEMSKEVDDLYEGGNKEAAITLLQGKSKELFDQASEELLKLMDLNKRGSDGASNAADSLYALSKNIAIAVMVFLSVFGAFIVFTLVKSISTPIKEITDYMMYLSNGNLDRNVPSQELKDEVGDMARSVQVFKDNMVRAKELEAEQKKDEIAKQKRQENVNAAVEKFQHSMTDIVKFVSAASTELQASAQSLSSSAEETSKQSGAVAAASQQAAANVQTVASATEELSSSINEIASQVSRSSQVAGKAVQDAEQAGASVAELVEAAQKIGDVTKIISGIAEQTNLLALNATIEAARAGDAGKGFAVVASEVKNLANESTKATEEIAGQIAHIQQISQTSAEAINMICNVIREIDEISGIISAAIQEQTSATQEISRNVTEAYTGTSEVTQNIGSVSDAANDTGSSAHQVLSAADELSRQSGLLKEEFDTFIHSLEAA